MENRKKIIERIAKWALIFLVAVVFIFPGSPKWMDFVAESHAETAVLLDTGWTWNGEAVASLAEYDGVADENNEIHLATTLTEDMVLDGEGAFLFRSAQQTLRVFLDEELIYTYDPLDTQIFGKLAPSQWNYIPLSSDDVGKEITFVTHCSLAQFANTIQEIRYGETVSLHEWVFQTYLPVFLSNVFLISIGGLLLIVTLFPARVRWMRLAGLFTIAMGIWGVGESKFTDFMQFGNYAWGILTFEAILFGICLYTGFTCSFIRRRIKNVSPWIEGMAVTNLLLQNLFYFSGAFEFMEMLVVNHILAFVIAFINIYYIVRYRNIWVDGENSLKPFIYIQWIYFVSLFVEIALYLNGYVATTGYFFRIGISLYIISVVGLSLQSMLKDVEKSAKLSEELLQYRVSIAKSQIKPHFIFNTLTSIQTLIKIDQDEAYRLVSMFAKYLRVNMTSFEKNELIPFDEEVRHIRTYVEIEKVRFGSERVSVVYDLREVDFLIPALSIQPIVENAIKHGICKKKGGGVVTLRSYAREKETIIEVIDTGVGFDVKEIEERAGEQGGSIGIANVRFRLGTLVHAQVVVKSIIGKGSSVKIVIPKELRK